MNVRVEQGIHGGRWVFENIRSSKPLRKLLAIMLSSTFMKDRDQQDMILNRAGMWFAMVNDINHLRKVLAGDGAAKVACMEIPAELQLSMVNFDATNEFLFGSLLQDSNVALLVRFHRNKTRFINC